MSRALRADIPLRSRRLRCRSAAKCVMPVSRSAFIWSQTSAACGFAAAACRASSKIGAVRLPVLLGESGDGGADVRAGERGALVDRAGEEALAERAEGDEADAELLQGRQHPDLG